MSYGKHTQKGPHEAGLQGMLSPPSSRAVGHHAQQRDGAILVQ
jgi:hypothetical protein